MKCPNCNHSASKVINSREVYENLTTYRRRQCIECGHRWSTIEVMKDQFKDQKIVESDMVKLIKATLVEFSTKIAKLDATIKDYCRPTY